MGRRSLGDCLYRRPCQGGCAEGFRWPLLTPSLTCKARSPSGLSIDGHLTSGAQGGGLLGARPCTSASREDEVGALLERG